MEADQSRLLFLLFLFTWRLSPEVAAEVQESSDGSVASQKPMWLTDVPATMEFIAVAEVAVIGFFQAWVLELEQHKNSFFMGNT